MTSVNSTRIVCSVLLIAASSVLGGCQSFRDAIGSGKESPDEFAVVTKAPLIMPPDFNLHPPKPGAPPANQVAPTQAAQNALFNTDVAANAAMIQGDLSPGEKLLLANAGAQAADGSIRQVIAADNKNMQSADEGFTNNLMFWQKPAAQNDPAVDADAEAAKLPPPGAKPAAASDPTIQKDDGSNNAH